jgi:hypothetical protein
MPRFYSQTSCFLTLNPFHEQGSGAWVLDEYLFPKTSQSGQLLTTGVQNCSLSNPPADPTFTAWRAHFLRIYCYWWQDAFGTGLYTLTGRVRTLPSICSKNSLHLKKLPFKATSDE